MLTRSRSSIETTLRECLVEAAGGGLLTIFVVLAVFELPHLPPVFPVFLGAGSRPAAWGTPNVLALLPAVAAVIYVALSVLQLFPESYRYRTAVTEANAIALYRRGRSLVRAVKISATLTFATVFHFAVRAAEDSPKASVTWRCEPHEHAGLECWPVLSAD